jgi:hypothetical protein
MTFFKAEFLFLIDDGSEDVNIGLTTGILDPDDLPETLENRINFVRFEDNLGRPTHIDYQGWWRSFLFPIIIAQKYGFDKMIHIESDFYVVSQDLMEYIGNAFEGWTAFYSKFHMFPETGIQVICKDAFGEFIQFRRGAIDRDFKVRKSAEYHLPFTKIEKRFQGDRLGQLDVIAGWLNIVDTPCRLDYVGQVLPRHRSVDFEPFFDFEFKWD